MAAPPKQTQFRLDTLGTVPEELRPVFTKLLDQLNNFTAPVGAALTQGLTRSDNMDSAAKRVAFTVHSDTFPMPVKNDLAGAPGAVWVGQLRRQDGVTITDPWSFSWQLDSRGNLQTAFQGLADGVSYAATLILE